jgi:hypothetical protein
MEIATGRRRLQAKGAPRRAELRQANPTGLDPFVREERFQLSDRKVVGASVSSHFVSPALAGCKEDAGADYTQPGGSGRLDLSPGRR